MTSANVIRMHIPTISNIGWYRAVPRRCGIPVVDLTIEQPRLKLPRVIADHRGIGEAAARHLNQSRSAPTTMRILQRRLPLQCIQGRDWGLSSRMAKADIRSPISLIAVSRPPDGTRPSSPRRCG